MSPKDPRVEREVRVAAGWRLPAGSRVVAVEYESVPLDWLDGPVDEVRPMIFEWLRHRLHPSRSVFPVAEVEVPYGPDGRTFALVVYEPEGAPDVGEG